MTQLLYKLFVYIIWTRHIICFICITLIILWESLACYPILRGTFVNKVGWNEIIFLTTFFTIVLYYQEIQCTDIKLIKYRRMLVMQCTYGIYIILTLYVSWCARNSLIFKKKKNFFYYISVMLIIIIKNSNIDLSLSYRIVVYIYSPNMYVNFPSMSFHSFGDLYNILQIPVVTQLSARADISLPLPSAKHLTTTTSRAEISPSWF